MSEQICANGIDATTGGYLLDPVDVDELAAAIVAEPPSLPDEAYLEQLRHAQEPSFGLSWEVDPLDLSQAGWAVAFAADENEAVKAALEPLMEHRAAQVGDDTRFHVLEIRPGETFLGWIGRHGPAPGTVDPTLVPYYVLLVGGPELIPFDFQYLLDVEYAVGRLHFDDVAGYENYAKSVVEYETARSAPHDRSAFFFGTRHMGDPATELSAESLVGPLGRGDGDRRGEATTRGYRSKVVVGDDGPDRATRATLAAVLDGADPDVGRPALVFTATHGLGLPADHPSQRDLNGALLCQDWTGGPPTAEQRLAGSDVTEARVHGLVAFLFACYSAGTPLMDEFPGVSGGTRAAIARSPFVASLPQALLGHDRGGGLAVIGHVERAWGYSIASFGRSQLQPYNNALGQILVGRPVGHAMRDFNERFAVLSARLADLLRDISFGATPDPRTIVNAWTQRNDAQGFVVLGDPAVRLQPPSS